MCAHAGIGARRPDLREKRKKVCQKFPLSNVYKSEGRQPPPHATRKRHMDYAKPLFHAVLLASLTLTACVSAPGEVEEQVGQAQQDALIGNALIGNALIGNALIGNALIGNALIGNALIGNALIGNALTRAALTGDAPTNANAREVLSFIVGCALPADETLVYTVGGVTYSDPGALGLAPEWGQPGGQCDESCQQWVSACVISQGRLPGPARRDLGPRRPRRPRHHAGRAGRLYPGRGDLLRRHLLVAPEHLRLPRARQDRDPPRLRPVDRGLRGRRARLVYRSVWPCTARRELPELPGAPLLGRARLDPRRGLRRFHHRLPPAVV